MRTVTINAKIETRTVGGDRQTVLERTFENLDVMKMQTVRTWVTRNTNKTMKDSPRDTIVVGSYWGQFKESPFHTYSGSLSGLNGKIMRRDGEYDT